MATEWRGGDGATITGTLTAGAVATTPPPPVTTGPTSGRYDGVYDFIIRYPTGSTTSSSQNIARFMTIRDGSVSSADGTMAGRVDNDGRITFTWPCIITPNSLADFRGDRNLSEPRFEGTYDCRMPHDNPRSWEATQSR